MNYRNNGSAPAPSAKRKAVVSVDSVAPSAKRPKVVIDLDIEPTQPIEDPESIESYYKTADSVRASVDRNLAAKNAAATAPFPAPEDDVVDAPKPAYTGWRPRVGPAEVNFRFDHDMSEKPVGDDAGSWTYSSSLKGWCRYPCVICTVALGQDEVQTLLDHRTGIPTPLARDTRNPPEYKLRVVPLCSNCITASKKACRQNPQAYNGRGNAIWIFPF